MFVQWCLTEVSKQSVQAVQRHGRWRSDFHTDRLSVLRVIDHQQPDQNPLRDQCYTDVMSTEELLAEALRLTRIDRARVAEELLSSLEESDEEVATAWATELERRSREVAGGRVQTISWETARTEILKELEQRRAPRTAP